MFCENCGTKLPDDAKFCPECGAKVNAAPVTVQTLVPPTEVRQAKTSDVRRKKSSKIRGGVKSVPACTALTKETLKQIVDAMPDPFPSSYVYLPYDPASRPKNGKNSSDVFVEKFLNKCDAVLKSYGRGYVANVRDILLLSDDTVFGKGDEGFVLTEKGIVSSYRPYFIAYQNIRTVRGEDDFHVNGYDIAILYDAAANSYMEELLHRIIQTLRRAGMPKRTDASKPSGGLFPLTQQRFDAIVADMTFPDGNVYTAAKPSPEKFRKKLAKAMKAYGTRYMGETGTVYLLYDDTFFGACDDGYLLTDTGIVCSVEPHFIAYEDITEFHYEKQELWVNKIKLNVIANTGVPEFAAEVLKRILHG